MTKASQKVKHPKFKRPNAICHDANKNKKSNPKLKIVIEGHTDSVGAADYNLKLSDERANAVRQALVDRGVESGRMEAIGYGESKPIASNKSRPGRASNRRVEFNIVKK